MYRRFLLVTIVSLFVVLLTSCDGDDIEDNVIIDLHKKEGLIKLSTNGEELVFPEITEFPFVKYAENGIDYDTVGFAYTAYLDESRSIIGSLKIIILHDKLELYYVDYVQPMSEVAGLSYCRWNEDRDNINPLEYAIKEQNGKVEGSFKGNLYSGGSSSNVFPVDNCTFYIYK